ncbi:hypothetical protein REC12_20290 [Desulfosporosinus sp. PR]|uniref:hypothetical protein n=1 Tax=Candidatus Desulfosporosinus nitrosoreducens TaxID=3401928 RepID=UPI0027F39DBB|nr:hypothetical protein [Desulfosporosinus sp. PR]MDQ7095937.1 hypothetical protein [Desulfosporosinus sp. PR]
MTKQDWLDNKQSCISNAAQVINYNARLQDANGVQFVPSNTQYIPPAPSAYIYVIEYEVVGGTADWRVNSTSEYLLSGETRIYQTDCTDEVSQ